MEKSKTVRIPASTPHDIDKIVADLEKDGWHFEGMHSEIVLTLTREIPKKRARSRKPLTADERRVEGYEPGNLS